MRARSALPRYRAVAALVTAAALWGLGGTVASELFRRGANPLEVVALRTWISLAGLGVLLAWRRSRRGRSGPFPWLTVIGFGLSVVVANSALFIAISKLPVAVALVLQNLAPVFVVGWSLAATRSLPGGRVIMGLVAALAGVAFVVELPTVPLGSINLPGVVFGLLTAAGIASFSALGGRAARACGAITANMCAFAVSSVVWLLYQIPRGLPTLFFRPGLLVGTVAIGVLGTLAPFLLYSWGIARLGPQVGAVNICLEPVFGAVLAWAWLGQTLRLSQIAGAVVLLVAVIDLQRTGPPAVTARQPSPARRSLPGQDVTHAAAGEPLLAACRARIPRIGLTCWSTLGARAHSPHLSLDGPGVRLAGAPGAEGRREGCGDLGAPARGCGLAPAGHSPEAGLG